MIVSFGPHILKEQKMQQPVAKKESNEVVPPHSLVVLPATPQRGEQQAPSAVVSKGASTKQREPEEMEGVERMEMKPSSSNVTLESFSKPIFFKPPFKSDKADRASATLATSEIVGSATTLQHIESMLIAARNDNYIREIFEQMLNGAPKGELNEEKKAVVQLLECSVVKPSLVVSMKEFRHAQEHYSEKNYVLDKGKEYLIAVKGEVNRMISQVGNWPSSDVQELIKDIEMEIKAVEKWMEGVGEQYVPPRHAWASGIEFVDIVIPMYGNMIGGLGHDIIALHEYINDEEEMESEDDEEEMESDEEEEEEEKMEKSAEEEKAGSASGDTASQSGTVEKRRSSARIQKQKDSKEE